MFIGTYRDKQSLGAERIGDQVSWLMSSQLSYICELWNIALAFSKMAMSLATSLLEVVDDKFTCASVIRKRRVPRAEVISAIKLIRSGKIQIPMPLDLVFHVGFLL